MTATIPPVYASLLDAAAPSSTPRVLTHAGWSCERWDELLAVAAWHRLLPAAHAHLDGDGAVPADVAERLRDEYLANAARNLYLAQVKSRVLEALADADVPAMPLKGAALVETVYPDPAVREMLDLDILVAPDRMAAANEAVRRLGFRPDPGSPAAEQADEVRLIAGHHDAALVGEDELTAIELHRHIALPGEAQGFSVIDLWKRARPAPHGPHLLPAPEDLLLHVCLHFTRNRLGGSYRRMNTGGALAQIGDIARIVDGAEIDWSALAASGREYRMDVALFLGLFAAAELGVAVPAAALAEMTPRGFDPAVGRRLVTLRVLRTGNHLPVRSARWMVAPSRDALRKAWGAEPGNVRSFAMAYLRRARAQLPRLRVALRRPLQTIQDQRLNRQLLSLQEHR